MKTPDIRRMNDMNPNFHICLRLNFQAVSEICLPLYKGSTFRGVFKTALKHVCCPSKNAHCHQCRLTRSCAYNRIAENRTTAGENTVLPYTFDCAHLQANLYGTGEELALNPHLYGRAIDFLPHIVYSLTIWEKHNLGCFQPLIADKELNAYGPPHRWPLMLRPRGRLRLLTVEQISQDREILFDSRDGLLKPPHPEPAFNPIDQESDNYRVRLDFRAPTRLFRKTVNNGGRRQQLIQPDQVTFELLFRALLTRFIGLNLHFGDGAELLDQKQWDQLQDDVRRVKMVENRLKMVQVRRYRRNNTRWIHLDGFMGAIAFENVSTSLVQYFQMGTAMHIGKFPTMGYGEYALCKEIT